MNGENTSPAIGKSGLPWRKIALVVAGVLTLAAVLRMGFVRSEICDRCSRNNTWGFACGPGGFTGVAWIDRIIKISGGPYTKNGAVEIDTNRVERSIRGWKLGLKNWLFLGSDDGGQWGALMFSLIESCKLHRINPEAYLKDVLVRISTTPQSQIESLMPRCWGRPSTTALDSM